LAAKEVQAYIASHPEIREDADKGKMFGVLVVEAYPRPSQKGGEKYGFLAAYSGLLAGRNDWEYFVPPVYDAQQPDGYFKTKEREISLLHSSETSADQNALEQNSAAADSSFKKLSATHNINALFQWL
jgi:tRNA pseudouridine32 synthase/23S rRNA pseudouridine746 synthase